MMIVEIGTEKYMFEKEHEILKARLLFKWTESQEEFEQLMNEIGITFFSEVKDGYY